MSFSCKRKRDVIVCNVKTYNYAVLATGVGCEQPSQRVVLTFLARGFVTLCDYIVEFIHQLLTVRNCGTRALLRLERTMNSFCH